MKKRVLILAAFLLLVFVFIALEYNLLRPLNTAVRSFVGANLYRPFYYVSISLHYFFETGLGTIQTLLWAAVIFFVYKSRSGAMLLVAAMFGQSIAVGVLKILIRVQRPPQEYFGVLYHTFSYPSGHTTTAITMTIMLAWIIHFKLKRREGRLIASVYAVLTLATGYSRMFLDVHWVLDVIGGLALGGFISLIIIASEQKYKTFSSGKA
jgi:undecaprenyl-diphosphatase